MTDKQYHRIRHYPGTYSNFDLVEECTKPKWCCGCEFEHAFCTEAGKVIDPEKYRDKLETEARRYGRGGR